MGLSDRIDTEIRDRENAIAELTARTDGQNQERIDDISDLKTKMMQENAYLRSLSGKTLLSIRKNGEEIASIFDQNHKDNHKNSMAGQNIIMDVKRGDEIVVYAYTGTWLADFPMN